MWGPGVGTGEQSGIEGEEQAGESEGKAEMLGLGLGHQDGGRCWESAGGESGYVRRTSSTWPGVNLTFPSRGAAARAFSALPQPGLVGESRRAWRPGPLGRPEGDLAHSAPGPSASGSCVRLSPPGHHGDPRQKSLPCTPDRNFRNFRVEIRALATCGSFYVYEFLWE